MPRLALLLASLIAATAVQAQSVPSTPPPSDSWNRPVPASSVIYRGNAPATAGSTHTSHFKFKERRPYTPPRNAAREHAGKAPVGIGTVDPNGRPAVSCVRTPMDPACH